MEFIGKWFHSIDSKNRIVIPSKIRKEEKKFILTPGFDNCLYIYPQDRWQKMMEKIENLSLKNKSHERAFKRFFFSSAHEVEVDKQGRLSIPKELMSLCKLKRNVVVLGTKDRLEVWSKDGWNRYYNKRKKLWEKISQEMEF